MARTKTPAPRAAHSAADTATPPAPGPPASLPRRRATAPQRPSWPRCRSNPAGRPREQRLPGGGGTDPGAGGDDRAVPCVRSGAARLSAADCDVDLRAYPESVRGFTSFPGAMAAATTRGIESWLAKQLAGE